MLGGMLCQLLSWFGGSKRGRTTVERSPTRRKLFPNTKLNHTAVCAVRKHQKMTHEVERNKSSRRD